MAAKILGISGRIGAGKTTLSKELCAIGPGLGAQPTALADGIKYICHEILGLTREQCWGTQEQKNAETPYRLDELLHGEVSVEPDEYDGWSEPAMATARQVMQHLGTELFRRHFGGDVWVNHLVRRAERLPGILVCDDVRFPNEVEGIQRAGGKVIRLLKGGQDRRDDEHISEQALDLYKGFDGVIDNEPLKPAQTLARAMDMLGHWGWTVRR